MSVDRDELRTKAAECGWVLAFSCPTLDQFTLTATEVRAKREISVYFTAGGGVMTSGYESIWDEKDRFLGRPIEAEQVSAAIMGAARESAPVPVMAPNQ